MKNDGMNEKGEIHGSDLIFTCCVRIFLKEIKTESDSPIEHAIKTHIGIVTGKVLM